MASFHQITDQANEPEPQYCPFKQRVTVLIGLTVYFVAGPMLAGFTEGDCPKSPYRYLKCQEVITPPGSRDSPQHVFLHSKLNIIDENSDLR